MRYRGAMSRLRADSTVDQAPVLIVSNRLPITTAIDGDTITFTPAAGGLATGLRGCHERTHGLWIGWPGATTSLSDTARQDLTRRLRETGTRPRYLTAH